MKSCASCAHLIRFAAPVEGRGMMLAGACGYEIRSYARAPVVSESCGHGCRWHESAEDARARKAIADVLEREGAS